MEQVKRAGIVNELQMDILRLQGFMSIGNAAIHIELGPINNAFPNSIFPTGAVHEFLSSQEEDFTAAAGFVSGLLRSLMGNSGAVVWISCSRTLFPPALKSFGIDADRFIFIDLQNEKDVLWAMNEALKCEALSAVVGEMREIDFTASRRLQISVEQSKVTGFIIRKNYRKLNTTACISRWKITPLPSVSIAPDPNNVWDGGVDDLPGIGFPRWKVELLRMRNGKLGTWHVQWINRKFVFISPFTSVLPITQKKTG
jgi:protein ImuA